MEERRGVNFTGLLCGVVNVELVRRKRGHKGREGQEGEDGRRRGRGEMKQTYTVSSFNFCCN